MCVTDIDIRVRLSHYVSLCLTIVINSYMSHCYLTMSIYRLSLHATIDIRVTKPHSISMVTDN